MRLMPIALTALAAQTAAKRQLRPCNEGQGTKTPSTELRTMPIPLGFGSVGDLFAGPGYSDTDYDGSDEFVPHDALKRSVPGYAALSTRYNKCVDVPGGKFANGQTLQIFDCSDNANQQWKISGNTLSTTNNMCLDVPYGLAYTGAPLQLWTCDKSNRNQMFEVAGNSIRKKNTNFCVDIKDGQYANGAKLQLWNCDWNAGGNQILKLGATKAVAAVANPSSFLGFPSISWDKFAQLHPECASYGSAMVAAAAANGLVPSLLGALAETESSCRERPNTNPWGLMQFSDDGAWRAYGGGGDRQKASDAIWAAARYMRALLDQNNQNLNSALRAYNGPISQGGNPGYAKEIATWMSGGSNW